MPLSQTGSRPEAWSRCAKLGDHMEPFLERLDERAAALQVQLSPLVAALSEARCLPEYREALRHDLLCIQVLLGYSWDRIGARELAALAALDWALVQSLGLGAKIQQLSARGDWVAQSFLEAELERYRFLLKEHGGETRFQVPHWAQSFESNPVLSGGLSRLATGLYAYYSLVVRLDGKVDDRETRGFRAFWEAYKALKTTESPPCGVGSPSSAPADTGLPEAARRVPSASEQVPRFVPQAWGIAGSSPMESAPPSRPSASAAVRAESPSPGDPASPPPVPTAAAREDELASALSELDALVGLSSVKDDVRKLSNLLKVQVLRRERHLAEVPVSLHVVFTGNPGTGKTTVARLYARILKGLGLLERGHLVETDRAGLVAGYMGQTAEKVDEIVRSALDGVLFVDEAYALTTGDSADYGKEAVAALIARMETFRTRLVVVAAGYGPEMETFLESNPGLRSRFPHVWEFPDYDPGEMEEIFLSLCRRYQLELSPQALDALVSRLEALQKGKDGSFGNARAVRNLFEAVVSRQADRVAGGRDLSDKALCSIEESDLGP